MTAFPKVGKRLQTKQQADAAADRKGSAECRKRSEGRCEVVIVAAQDWRAFVIDYMENGPPGRCPKRAAHVMHLIGGRGKRGRGISALAQHKLHGCPEHHREIDGDLGGKRLRRIGGPIPLYTDVYERIR